MRPAQHPASRGITERGRMCSSLARWLHPEARDAPIMRDVHLNLDRWDGYQWERGVLTDALRGTDGLVVLTGDLHSFIAGTLQTRQPPPVVRRLLRARLQRVRHHPRPGALRDAAVWSVRSRRRWTWPVRDVTIGHGQRVLPT